MNRTYIGDIGKKHFGKEVMVRGWAADIRDLAKIKFLIIKDITGKLQAIALKDTISEDLFREIGKIHPESAVEIKGKINQSKQARQGFELQISNLDILADAQTPLPIDTSPKSQTLIDKRLDYRFLDLRNDRVQAIFKIQSTIANSFRQFLKNNSYIEIQPPSIIATATEGGTDLFPAKYFEKNAYLAQSPQLYKQMCAISIEKVFTITPVWRAEKHNTIRHLNESRQMDIEVAFANEFDVMKIFEDVVKYMVEEVNKQNQKELDILGLKLKTPKEKYLTYKETIELLKKNKIPVKQGDDIPPEGEKKLCDLYPDAIVFVHSWPVELKPFYIWPKEDGTTGGFDAIYGGIEISSGGQRVHIPEILEKQLKAKGLKPKDFEYYVSAFRYGAPQHSGWSIGLERFTMALLKLDNIREACLFPRDRDRLTP
jgi:aspartyl-tRNA synthetase